jgi:hygromycin-B 4-O-kinase
MTKPAVSPSRILAHLAHRFADVSDFQRVSEGEESQAFGFASAGSPYIARVNPSSAGFEKDRFVFQRFASADLPVPRIAAIDLLGDGDNWCCVSRRAAGITLQDMACADLPAIVEPVSKILDAIAGADTSGTNGFGPFDASGAGSFGSWRDFLLAGNDDCRDWSKAAARIDMMRVRAILDRTAEWVAHCPEMRNLVHGDFGSNNVLADAGRITGVIDWSEALFGDPLYDVANILFWRPWLDCMEQQARFFETRQPDRLHHRQRLLCYQLRIGIEVLYDAALDGSDADLDWALARCEIIAQSS